MGADQNLFLLLDSKGAPLAQARPQGPTTDSGQMWQLMVLDDKVDLVLEHKQFKLMSIRDASPSYEGTLVRSRQDMILLEVRKTPTNGSDMRKNLRVPVCVKSFIYPVDGGWRGRRDIETNDLSCGGIAFFCEKGLSVGEHFEVVIPVTSEPLVVQGEVLRKRPIELENTVMYAAKFINLCNDEETLMREAVFNLQLSGRPRQAGR